MFHSLTTFRGISRSNTLNIQVSINSERCYSTREPSLLKGDSIQGPYLYYENLKKHHFVEYPTVGKLSLKLHIQYEKTVSNKSTLKNCKRDIRDKCSF